MKNYKLVEWSQTDSQATKNSTCHKKMLIERGKKSVRRRTRNVWHGQCVPECNARRQEGPEPSKLIELRKRFWCHFWSRSWCNFSFDGLTKKLNIADRRKPCTGIIKLAFEHRFPCCPETTLKISTYFFFSCACLWLDFLRAFERGRWCQAHEKMIHT